MSSSLLHALHLRLIWFYCMWAATVPVTVLLRRRLVRRGSAALPLAPALSPPSPKYMSTKGAPLVRSAEMLRKCRSGTSDIDLTRFVAAAKQFDEVMAPFGLYSKVMVLATREQLEYLQKAPAAARSTARALLLHEKASGKHTRRPQELVDGSPAIALLWMRRGFEFWLGTFEQHVSRPRSFSEECWRGYLATSAKFNGWMMRKLAAANHKLAPPWETICARGLCSEVQLKAQLKAWCAAVRPVIDRLTALHREAGLDDLRLV